MSVPSTVLYFNAYDELHKLASAHSWNVFGPMLSGMSARILAATAVSPFELIRTRAMAHSASGNVVREISMDLVSEIRTSGIPALFRGLGPTLWRDVPFSGIYWSAYERIKAALQSKKDLSLFQVSFFSGASSGMLSALVTHPFDVIKTRRQVELLNKIDTSGFPFEPSVSKQSTSELLVSIVRTEGVSALFVGVVPRIVKIAPACAIMISSYELFKTYFANQSAQESRIIA
jgi:solute carrier family 25 protein 39/40